MKPRTAGSRLKSRLLLLVLAGVLVAIGFTQLRKARVNATVQQSQTPVEELRVLDSKNFDRSTQIDNQWFPLKPGTRFIYEGFTMEA